MIRSLLDKSNKHNIKLRTYPTLICSLLSRIVFQFFRLKNYSKKKKRLLLFPLNHDVIDIICERI